MGNHRWGPLQGASNARKRRLRCNWSAVTFGSGRYQSGFEHTR